MNLTPQTLIAKGGHRHTYTTEDPNWVIKVQQGKGNYNYAEWCVWHTLKTTRFHNLLAPCGEISEDHMHLLQRRGRPLPDGTHLPIELLPDFLAYDVRLPRQWIIIPGYNADSPVLCDYDHNQYGMMKRMNLL